jgi:hypothetical protein
MPIQNLRAGAVKTVVVNEIKSVVHVYRTSEGSDAPGQVGWQRNGGVVQMQPIAVGQTVNFNINGAPGMLANACRSVVQLLWQNTAAVAATNIKENAARKFLKAPRTKIRAAAAKR